MNLADYYNTGDDTYVEPSIAATDYLSRAWTALSSYDLTAVRLKVARSGSPGTVHVRIYAADASDKPTGAILSAGAFDGDSLTADPAGEWKTVELVGTPIAIGSKHCIIAYADGLYFRWRAQNIFPGYTGGKYADSHDAGLTWTTYTSYHPMFETYWMDKGHLPPGIWDDIKDRFQPSAGGSVLASNRGIYSGTAKR